MKKLQKIMAGVISLALVVAAIVGLFSVSAAPNTITVKEADYTRDFVGISNFGMTMFTTTDGNVIYCMDIDKKPLAGGQTATFAQNGDAGLLYILQNGYPKKTYKNNRGMDAEITQMAIWWYLSESKLSSEFKNANDQYGIVASTKKLVNEARNASDTQAQPSMSINASGVSFTLTSDSKYYESGYMSATLVNAKTYNVTLTGATKSTTLVDGSGKNRSTFNSGEKFKVRVPASEVSSKLNITVNYAATGLVQKAKIYKPSDSSYQRVVGLYDEVTNLAKSNTLVLVPVKRTCEYDGTNYYGKDGNIVDKKTYNKECGHICEYTNGKYYGKDGDEVNKATYIKECKHICEYTGGKYYGKNGDEVNKTTYEKECKKSCEYTDGKYYGKDGNEVDKTTYEKECMHVCEYTNGKYYGKDGKVVGQKTFEKECKKNCEYDGTNYYGKDGNVVSEKEFNKQCKEQLTCAVVDGKYYGKNGNIVGEKTYADECGTSHICEYTDDKYFGSYGQEVDKSTFDNQCGLEVVVPNTGSNVSPLAVTFGIILMSIGTYVIVSRKKQLS